jgi:hypothetical protein
MYEWLEDEIRSIKTPRFHVVDGPAVAKLKDAVLKSDLPIPRSYREFVLKFGNAKLYHRAKNDSYEVGVFAAPRAAELDKGTRVFHLGYHDGASVYVKIDENSTECPVFEYDCGAEENVAADFEQWLTESCDRARSRYPGRTWEQIIRGPEPFTATEHELIEARRRIRWAVVGIDAEGDHIIEVENRGTRPLRLLTVGVRSKDRRLNGAVRIRIGHIMPGQRDIVHASCYKDLRPPGEIELFSLPDPQPEDRERFPELSFPG